MKLPLINFANYLTSVKFQTKKTNVIKNSKKKKSTIKQILLSSKIKVKTLFYYILIKL